MRVLMPINLAIRVFLRIQDSEAGLLSVRMIPNLGNLYSTLFYLLLYFSIAIFRSFSNVRAIVFPLIFLVLIDQQSKSKYFGSQLFIKHKMKILGNVIKSRSDKRIYSAIKLKNDLQCLIISDKESFKSSAALSVGVGSLQDPYEAQGLAHYLEHMLFMGTKKYPDQNDYSNFIAKNFGSSNAYTAQDLTNYHFQVASNAFQQTLDRFAQFFICPLMSDSSSERELNAVNSQHVKNLQNDMWRKYQLSKHIAKDGHPLKKFSTGNLASLSSPNLREMLHKFYEANYSSNLMKLVVLSNQGPQQLSRIVSEKFSQIPNKNYKKFHMKQWPYNQQTFQKTYKMLPIKDNKTLQLIWTLPNKSQHYENHPGKYLSHLFGHQGKGSLFSFLMSEGLAFGLSAHSADSFNCYNQFQVSISLTKKGIQQYERVIRYTINYLEMLKNQKPQQWVFEQIRKVNEMKFNFMQKKQGMMFTAGLARKLQQQKIEEVLAHSYFMKSWKPALIQEYLSEMKSENLMIFLQAKQVEKDCTFTEPIYETKYGISSLQNSTPLSCPVSLPQRNPYIPTNFQLAQMGTNKYPTKFYQTPMIEGYFKKDHKFQLPKVNLLLKVYFSGVQSPRSNISRKIYLDMLNEKMRQFTYLGDAAEISSGIQFSNCFSANIGISGFRDAVMKYNAQFLRKIFQFKPDDKKLFQNAKQKFERIYENYFLGDPFRLAYNTMNLSLRHGVDISPEEKLSEIKTISFDDVIQFGKNWNKKLFVESFLGGNIENQDAMSLHRNLEQLLTQYAQPLEKDKIGEIRPVKLSSNFTSIIQDNLISKQQQNSAIIVHFQNTQQISINNSPQINKYEQIKQSLLQALCYNFMKQPAFDYLRTKQQLGYIVMCLPDDNRGIAGMSILVQSAVKISHQLIGYVNIFLQQILKNKLQTLTEETFQQYKTSLKISKKQADKNLGEQTSRFWAQITKHQFIFDRRQKQVELIESITLKQFKNYVNLLLFLNPKRLQIHAISQQQRQKNQQLLQARLQNHQNIKIFNSIQNFRKTMDLYPDMYCRL